MLLDLAIPDGFSKKLCWDNGTWYVHPGFHKEYTIYECGAIHNHKFMVGLSIILHSVSALLLLPAIIIFSFYAQLKIQRILMHKHLCTSLLLYGIASIAIDYVLIWNEFPGPGRFEIVASNPGWPRCLQRERSITLDELSERFWSIRPEQLCGDQLCRDCALGRGCTLAEPNATEDSDVVSSFGNALYLSKWKQCCNAAWRCCQSMVSVPQVSDAAEPHCPRTWDGWTCYEDTQGGSMVEKPCPAHAYYHSVEQPCQRFSKKLCWDNGTWYVHPGFHKEYTIYECGAIHNHKFMVGLSIILHSVSALLLLPAIIIFSFYAQLKIQRILMHKHLCTSLLLYGIASIAIDYVLIWNEFPGPGRFEIVASNPAWCKLLIIGWRYFRLAQYHWMFCEAFYLNRLITTAFAEQKSVLLYYSVGWGFPAVFLATYAVFRAKHGDTKCWIEPLDHYEWIVLFPGLLCLIKEPTEVLGTVRTQRLHRNLRSKHPSNHHKHDSALPHKRETLRTKTHLLAKPLDGRP
ncbi:calcitonin gene-related peptide type 1 receptor [Ixodes scapularis]